jgi:uncharacterized protein
MASLSRSGILRAFDILPDEESQLQVASRSGESDGDGDDMDAESDMPTKPVLYPTTPKPGWERKAETWLEKRRSPIHGWGVFALCDIPADQPLLRYYGVLLNARQRRRRFGLRTEHGTTATRNLWAWHYTLHLGRRCVDGSDERYAGLSRYVNHGQGKAANCYFNGNGTVCTRRVIRTGEELLASYGGQYTKELKLRRLHGLDTAATAAEEAQAAATHAEHAAQTTAAQTQTTAAEHTAAAATHTLQGAQSAQGTPSTCAL